MGELIGNRSWSIVHGPWQMGYGGLFMRIDNGKWIMAKRKHPIPDHPIP